jgi:hypothetical protein
VVAQQPGELCVVDEPVAVGVCGCEQLLGVIIDAKLAQRLAELLNGDGAAAVLVQLLEGLQEVPAMSNNFRTHQH